MLYFPLKQVTYYIFLMIQCRVSLPFPQYGSLMPPYFYPQTLINKTKNVFTCMFAHGCQALGCSIILYNFSFFCGPPGIGLQTPSGPRTAVWETLIQCIIFTQGQGNLPLTTLHIKSFGYLIVFLFLVEISMQLNLK